MKLDVDLPPPFTYAPQFLVQAAVGVVLKSIVELILPQCARRHSMFIAPPPAPSLITAGPRPARRRFISLLERDYTRWLNGTRDLDAAVGELMPSAGAQI